MARRKTNRRRLLSRGQRGGSQPTTGQRGGSKKKTTRRSSKAPALNITSLGQMDSLKKLMKNTSVMMVFVYADWCGHCQHFKPEWKNLERLP